MKPILPLLVALAFALPVAAEQPKQAQDPQTSQAAPASKPAPVAPASLKAPVLEVPMKTQDLGAMDRLLEKRMAEKRLPKSTSDIGLREVPKKKDAEQAAAQTGQY